MAEVSVQARKTVSTIPLVVNVTGENGEATKYQYDVARLGGRDAMQLQLLQAEFAKDKDRSAIVGAASFKTVLALTTPAKGSPAFLDLLDLVGDDQLEPLFSALMEAATSSTVEG